MLIINSRISHIRFSPQYDKIAFLDHPASYDNRGSVAVVDLAGHVRSLGGEWKSEQGLAWTPDGKEIWFGAVPKGDSLNLMAVDLAGKTRLVLNLPASITLQDIASDGRALVTLNAKRLALDTTALGSNDEVDLSWHDWNPARDISPDDQFVLFEDSGEGAAPGYSVVMRKLDGSLPVRLGEGSAGGLSPDGKWAIAISVLNPAQVTLLPTGQGQPRPIVTDGLEKVHNGWGRFLPNGQGIAVNANERGHPARCYLLDVSGGKPRPITPEGISCGTISHDSRWLAGRHGSSTFEIYPVDGGPPRIIPGLPPGFEPMQWTTDNLSIYVSRTGRIYKVNIATGTMTFVQELKPGVPAGVVTINPVVMSRDGKRVLYNYNQTLSTLYLVSGLH